MDLYFQLGRQNGAELRVALARAVMEYRMSSYRAIMASTAAILNSEATRIPEELVVRDEKGLGSVEALDEGVVRDIGKRQDLSNLKIYVGLKILSCNEKVKFQIPQNCCYHPTF